MSSLSFGRRFFSKPLKSYHNASYYVSTRFQSAKQQKPQSAVSGTRHVLKISDLSNIEINNILEASINLKTSPKNLYNQTLKNRTLLMLFEKPSLRTRVSFEVGMTDLGGHAIFYSIDTSPLGQKETFGDTGNVLSRYCDIAMARLNSRDHINKLAEYSTIPIINALDDYAHPCQMLADLLTIYEKKIIQQKYSSFQDLKFVYFGDIHNNVTYDLMRLCSLMGFKQCSIAGPISKGHEYNVEPGVMEECNQINNGCRLVITDDIDAAAADADVIYTDSWMSYGINKEAQKQRIEIFTPFQVTSSIMSKAKKDCIFMNCLPAMRGMEQTEEVIDGKQSVVFDQAENRLHAQKALLLYLVNGNFNDNHGHSNIQ